MLDGQPPRCTLDRKRLARTVRLGVRFLDDLVTVTRHPLPEIEKVTCGNRKVGLGVMGFADMLIRMGVAYDSPEAVRAAEDVMSLISREADAASEELAAERGPFTNFAQSVYAARGRALRNAVRTTIAPTGSISIIAGCSGGIEPIFAVAFRRRVLGGELHEIHPDFVPMCEREGLRMPEDLMQEVLRTGRVRPLEAFPAAVRRLFVTSGEVPPEQHLQVQAAFQRHTDNAVSKTLNLPADSTPDEVRKVFLRAYELGCRGVTVYRDTSRLSQVLATECCELREPCER